MLIEHFLQSYLKERPLFLCLIRACEAALFDEHMPLKHLVLDVGCGDGYFASIMLAKEFQNSKSKFQINSKIQNPNSNFRQVIDVGLDLIGSRMEEARSLGVYKRLVIFDGVHIPFKDNKFTTVISNCVLEHVEDLPGLLSEIYRVLKPGGVFITTVMAKPWEDNSVGSMVFGSWYMDYMRKKQVHLNLLTKNEWRQVFDKSGFKIKKEIGYLSPKACRLIDICHYLSIPNLVSYKLFGRWVLTPGLQPYPINWLSKILSEPVAADESGALFYVLTKL